MTNISDWIKQKQGKYFCHCGCNDVIIIKKHHCYKGIPKFIPGHYTKCNPPWKGVDKEKHPSFGKRHSSETRKKISDNLPDLSGENNPFFGKHHTKETKLKISNTHKGKIITLETRKKMSKNTIPLKGKDHPNWKGGKRMSNARHTTQRRDLFKFIPLNNSFDNCDGHHLDFKHVLFIPRELHRSIKHSNVRYKNMKEINDIAFEWLCTQEIL